MREVKAHFDTQGTRRDEKNLLALANSPMPQAAGGGRGGGGGGNNQFQAAAQFTAKKTSSSWTKARPFWWIQAAATVAQSSCNRRPCRNRFHRMRSGPNAPATHQSV